MCSLHVAKVLWRAWTTIANKKFSALNRTYHIQLWRLPVVCLLSALFGGEKKKKKRKKEREPMNLLHALILDVEPHLAFQPFSNDGEVLLMTNDAFRLRFRLELESYTMYPWCANVTNCHGTNSQETRLTPVEFPQDSPKLLTGINTASLLGQASPLYWCQVSESPFSTGTHCPTGNEKPFGRFWCGHPLPTLQYRHKLSLGS